MNSRAKQLITGFLDENKPGLWDNIRKKKARMGSSYRPAKPGEKGRPSDKAWKTVTNISKRQD